MIDFSLSNALISAICSGTLLPVFHILLLRIFGLKKEKYLKVFLFISIITCTIIWIFIYYIIDDRSVFSLSSLDGVFFLGFIFIGYIEFYSLLRRGYSLRILYELYLKDVPISVKEIEESYSGGRGLGWFLEKRLEGIKNIGLIKITKDKIHLQKPFGRIVAKTVYYSVKMFGFKDIG